jgi:hypothetical protein
MAAPGLSGRFIRGLLFVAFAREYWQAWVFGEFLFGKRALAEEERRALGGLNRASVEARTAKADCIVWTTLARHSERIS